jgi:hypothetical protein
MKLEIGWKIALGSWKGEVEMIRIKLILHSFFAFMIVSALASCSPGIKPATQTPQIKATIVSAPSDSSTPITVQLIISTAPRLNEQADLTFTITSVKDAPNTTATITLPEGTDLISGDLEWIGDLIAYEPHTMQATIMFVTNGNKTLEAKALCDIGNGDVWGDAAYIYLNTMIEAGHNGFLPQGTQITTGLNQTPPAITPNP